MEWDSTANRRMSASVGAWLLRSARWFIFVVLFSLTSCATFNPYVTDPAPGGYSVKAGYQRADRYIAEYREAVRDQADLRIATGLLLIPMSALALRYSLLPGHHTAVVNLGVSAAGIYGTSKWLSNNRRALIYLSGVKAMGCIKRVMAPYKAMEQSTPLQNNRLAEEIGTLQTKITKAQSAYRALMPAAPESNLLTTAKEHLTAAQQTLVAGSQLQIKIAQAGPAMNAAIDQAANSVDSNLAGTLPTLAALSEINGKLASLAKAIERRSGPSGASGTEKRSASLSGLGTVKIPTKKAKQLELERKLKDKLAELADAQHNLAATTKPYNFKAPSKLLKQCAFSLATHT